MSIMRTYKEIRRLRQIANLLIKYEMESLIKKLNLKKHLSPLNKTKKTQGQISAKKIRLMMEELDGAFIKLGQLLSLRPDLIPEEYCKEFEKLQDEVNPIKFKQVKAIIEKNLNLPLGKIFKSFNPEPIASASVGQVHKAILKNNEVVAVKVRKPNIEEIFQTDINILNNLAGLSEKVIPEMKRYNPKNIVIEFEKYTENELNYLKEARNISKFYENFKNNKKIKIPKVFQEYTTKEVLVMEFIEGKKVSSLKFHHEADARNLSSNLAGAMAEQVIKFNIFHADPHPGNIFVTPKGEIAFLDFGIIGEISEDLSRKIETVFVGLLKPDKDMVFHGLLEVGFLDYHTNEEEFEQDLGTYLGEFYDTELDKKRMADFFKNIFRLAKKYNMELPSGFVLLGKSIITTEGTCKKIYPKFNIVKIFKPYEKMLIKQKTSMSYMTKNVKKTLLEYSRLITELPQDLKEIIMRSKSKESHDEELVDELKIEVEKASVRTIYGFIMAAIIIASSILFISGFKELTYKVLIISLILFIILFIFTKKRR